MKIGKLAYLKNKYVTIKPKEQLKIKKIRREIFVIKTDQKRVIAR